MGRPMVMGSESETWGETPPLSMSMPSFRPVFSRMKRTPPCLVRGDGRIKVPYLARVTLDLLSAVCEQGNIPLEFHAAEMDQAEHVIVSEFQP